MKKQSFDLAKMQVMQLGNSELVNIDGGGLGHWIKAHWGDTLRCGGGTVGGAGLGALAGAAVGTITLPIIGTVSGTAVGAVAGGLGGASQSCHF